MITKKKLYGRRVLVNGKNEFYCIQKKAFKLGFKWLKSGKNFIEFRGGKRNQVWVLFKEPNGLFFRRMGTLVSMDTDYEKDFKEIQMHKIITHKEMNILTL